MVTGGKSEWFWCLAVVRAGSWCLVDCVVSAVLCCTDWVVLFGLCWSCCADCVVPVVLCCMFCVVPCRRFTVHIIFIISVCIEYTDTSYYR